MSFKIQGKYTDAICFASRIDDKAVEQIKEICDQPFAKDQSIRIMPDAHPGAGCTIGTVMTIDESIPPSLVGVDIGCGMHVTAFKAREKIDDATLKHIDEIVHEIPSGFNVWDEAKFAFDFSKLRCVNELKKIERLEKSLGTLGGGNHFVEIDMDEDGVYYLIIHSGSRNLGVQVSKYYQNLGARNISLKARRRKSKDAHIKLCKELGVPQKIEKGLKKIDAYFDYIEVDEKSELIPISGKDFDDYYHDQKICVDFALLNRRRIAEYILSRLSGITKLKTWQNVHNYIDKNGILRKGATCARTNQPVLIPINMRDGCALGRGKGSIKWLCSAPHGAGRIMSRMAAKENLSVEEYENQMRNVFTTSVSSRTIDEAPMAYKGIDDILPNIAETVEVIKILKPIYNFKADAPDFRKEML